MITKIKPTETELMRSFMFLDIASGKSRNNADKPPERFNYVMYEAAKRRLSQQNLPPEQYEREMKRIAEVWGI